MATNNKTEELLAEIEELETERDELEGMLDAVPESSRDRFATLMGQLDEVKESYAEKVDELIVVTLGVDVGQNADWQNSAWVIYQKPQSEAGNVDSPGAWYLVEDDVEGIYSVGYRAAADEADFEVKKTFGSPSELVAWFIAKESGLVEFRANAAQLDLSVSDSEDDVDDEDVSRVVILGKRGGVWHELEGTGIEDGDSEEAEAFIEGQLAHNRATWIFNGYTQIQIVTMSSADVSASSVPLDDLPSTDSAKGTAKSR
jgi:hypothetical protein